MLLINDDQFFLCSFWIWVRVFLILCLTWLSWSVMWPCGHVRPDFGVERNRTWPGLGPKILARQLFRTWPGHIDDPIMSVIYTALYVMYICRYMVKKFSWYTYGNYTYIYCGAFGEWSWDVRWQSRHTRKKVFEGVI